MALPTTITGASFSSGHRHSYCGPFISSGGNVYVIIGNNDLKAFKATDPTTSFAEQDTTNNPATGSTGIFSFSVFQVSDELHVVAQSQLGTQAVAQIHYARFDMSTDAWDILDGGSSRIINVANPNTTSDALGLTSACDITVLSGGTIRIVTQGEQAKVMGTAYTQVVHYSSTDSGATWSAGTTVNSTTGDDHTGPTITLPPNNSDQCHIVYRKSSGPDVRTRALSSAGTLRTERTVPTVSMSGAQYGLRAISFDRSGTSKVRVAVRYVDSVTRFGEIAFDAFSDDTNPSISVQQFDGTTEVVNSTFVGTFTEDSSTVYALYSEGDGLNDESDLYVLNDQGTGTYTSSSSEFVGTVNHVSANVYSRSGSTVLAYIILDGSTVKYNELSLGGGTTQGTTAFSGSGTLSTSATLTIAASTAITASGSLVTAATLTIPATTAFSASGTLVTTATVAIQRTTTFTATGTLASAARLTATTAFSATGSLATVGTVAAIQATTAFDAAGTLATSARFRATTAFSASGTATTAATLTIAGTTAFAGTGTLASAGRFIASSAFTADGTLATTALNKLPAASTLYTGAGSLATSAKFRATTAASAAGSLATAARFAATTAFSATGSFSTTAGTATQGTTAFAGSGTLATSATLTIHGATAFTGSGTAATTARFVATTAVAASGSLTTTARFAVTSAFAGDGVLVTLAGLKLPGTSVATGSGSMSTVAIIKLLRTSEFAGSGVLTTIPGIKLLRSTIFVGTGSLTTVGVGGLASDDDLEPLYAAPVWPIMRDLTENLGTVRKRSRGVRP